MRRIRDLLAVAAVALLLAARASACLWDDDTLRFEASRLPDVLDVITGRFERNPPLYYEVRLARSEEQIAKDPDALGAYDNAGVACDRLGRGAEAIAWMERKRARLAAHPSDTEHLYRMHANLGTFLAHDWIRWGADRSDLSLVQRGRDEIAEAIRINPAAHFGREKVQLAAMDWILRPPPLTSAGEIPDLLHEANHGSREEDEETIRGLAGLVAMGNAWESVDVFHTLANCFPRRATIRHLARLRCEEILADGRASLHALATTPGSAPPLPLEWFGGSAIQADRLPDLDAWYRAARAAADRWNAERAAFMEPKLRAGRHPDGDPAFWDGFSPSAAAEAPSMAWVDPPGSWLARPDGRPSRVLVTGIAGAVLVLLIVLYRRGGGADAQKRQASSRSNVG